MTAIAQDDFTNDIKMLIDNNQYDKVIKQFASKSKECSPKALYYIGLAYFMKDDDKNCLKFMDLSIAKDSTYPPAYFKKASALSYMKKDDDAIKEYLKAIELRPEDGFYLSGLADSYYNLDKLDLALDAYSKAVLCKKVPDRAYARIGQIYSELNRNDKALEAYYNAEQKVSKESDSYNNILYNIGLLELLAGNVDKAEPKFLQLIQRDSTDYQNYAKLIQICYYRKDYTKAKHYKAILYDAYKKGKLKDSLKDMFCFDQFKWGDKLIQAFERYEDGSALIYEKHRFYVVNSKGDIECKIQTEYDRLSVELGGYKYILCMSKGRTHSTFDIGINDDYNYDDLKGSVINILENKVKPIASSKPLIKK